MSDTEPSEASAQRRSRTRRQSTPRSRRASGQGPLFDAATIVDLPSADENSLPLIQRLIETRRARQNEEFQSNWEEDLEIERNDRVQEPSSRRTNPFAIDESVEDITGERAPPPAVKAPERVDIRALDYISNVDNNLICPICQCPFLKPIQLECDHSFCEDCLQKSYEMRNSTARPCPTCRRPHSKVVERPAPRYVTRMLDELVVKCPNGCGLEVKRGDVQNHVVFYCGMTEVACMREGCQKAIWRKDVVKPCLHVEVRCEFCQQTMMKRDMEDHLASSCSKAALPCPHCREDILLEDRKTHADICPEFVTVCAGQPYGCHFSGKRSAVNDHTLSCPIATMTPVLEKQRSEQEEQRAAHESLQRKVQILEGGFAAMQNILYTAPSSTAATSAPPPLDISASNPASPNEALSAAPEAPFDTPTQHLLSLHESLRDELTRIETALTELDARSSMMLMNESQRNREEMAHANAAINSMRAQLHWLMSARLQQTQAQRSRVGTPPAGPSGGPGGGTAGGGSGGGVGVGAIGPMRRISGQETKL